MAKIFLINPLQSSGRSSYFPIGLMMLATSLRSNGIEVFFFDRNAFLYDQQERGLKDCDDRMLREIKTSGANIVGITMMTGHFEDIRYIAGLIKEQRVDLCLLAGGAHPTFEPERTLIQIPELDIVVRGPGELPLRRLCENAPRITIPNIVFRNRKGDNHVATPIQKSTQVLWSKPAYDLIDAEFYWRDKFYHTNSTHIPGLAMMMTSQGCPGKCTFCVDDRFLGNGFYQPDQEIFQEMSYLQNVHNRKAFFFVDRDFRLSKKNLVQFCHNKIKSSLKETPWTATIRADQIDQPLAKVLKASNCIRIVIGLESGSQSILNLLKKGTSVEQNFRAVTILNQNKILACGSFIYGLPGQTIEDLKSNIDFFRSVTLFDSAVLTFLPTVGSPLYNKLVKEEVLNPDDEATWKRIIDFNADLTPQRNYSGIPYETFSKMYHSHANEIFDTCSTRRNHLLEEYGLQQYFDYQ